jgi:hypothetical protein
MLIAKLCVTSTGILFFLLGLLLQAVAGLQPDGRQIVNRAQDEATQYKSCVLAGRGTKQQYSSGQLGILICWQ